MHHACGPESRVHSGGEADAACKGAGVPHDDSLIKISEMAALHGISRQTLILYDKNGLLHPAYVNESGYRYYSISQIPYLRLICLLKRMGVPLAEIREFMQTRSVGDVGRLLQGRRAHVESQIAQLTEQLREIQQLEGLFAHADTAEKNVNLPRIEWLPKRRAIFSPYPSGPMNMKKLHLALMGAWGELLNAGLLPSCGFGSMIPVAGLDGKNSLEGAGSIVIVPDGREIPGSRMVTLPEGEYVTMYKMAMPYELGPTRELLAWMDSRGLEPADNVFDLCILDTAFYDEDHRSDLCRVEIPLRSEG